MIILHLSERFFKNKIEKVYGHHELIFSLQDFFVIANKMNDSHKKISLIININTKWLHL